MDKVIVSRLAGGLGNQMFQYAAARALAHHHNASLLVDTSFLGSGNSVADHTIRDFELDVYKVQTSIASDRLLADIRPGKMIRILNRLGLIKNRITTIDENDITNPGDLSGYEPPLYLTGYWQNENYFLSIRDILLKEFVPKNEMSAQNRQVSLLIAGSNSASVHVRRGDYITNSNANKFHGVCSVEYYQSAISKLMEDTGVNHFFAFSDDIAWTKENLMFPVPVTFVDHNHGKESYRDMILMSQCNHQIIANSSFSWWGAWLNPGENKVVIAPANWFAAGGGDKIVPDNWIKL